MRQLSPAFIVTSLALALASGSALAQVSNAGTTAPRTSTTAPASNSTTPSAPSETNGLSGVNVTAPASTPSSSGASNSSTGVSNPAVTGDATANGAVRNTPNNAGATTGNGMQSGLVAPVIVTPVDAGVNASAATSNAGAANADANVNQAATPTPLFELAARQGMAKDAARRARGEEPRVYGIAPRTDRDLTKQMPDDPIIRY